MIKARLESPVDFAGLMRKVDRRNRKILFRLGGFARRTMKQSIRVRK